MRTHAAAAQRCSTQPQRLHTHVCITCHTRTATNNFEAAWQQHAFGLSLAKLPRALPKKARTGGGDVRPFFEFALVELPWALPKGSNCPVSFG
jgi:hypothetical protein